MQEVIPLKKPKLSRKIFLPSMNNQLSTIIETSGLDKTKAQLMLDNFTKFFEQAKEWESKAKDIVITDVSQVQEMQAAREARLALKKIRIETDKVRKELKEQSLRESRAIDGIGNVIKALIIPIEEHLEKQEKFAEIKEQKRKDKIQADRVAKLEPYVESVEFYNLKEMSEEAFNQLLTSSKAAVEEQEKAEEE